MHDVGEAARPSLGALQPHEQMQQRHHVGEMIETRHRHFSVRCLSRVGRQEGRHWNTQRPGDAVQRAGGVVLRILTGHHGFPPIPAPRRSMHGDSGRPWSHQASDATPDMMEDPTEEQAGLGIGVVFRGLVGVDERRHQLVRWAGVLVLATC
ncbi:hypothetical protein [Methylobacterium trifolii]|uniref:hypothetical protein n=1 Tax=Methylobacterium trifolii TaxID=1003092 RepID=UPI0035A24BEB